MSMADRQTVDEFCTRLTEGVDSLLQIEAAPRKRPASRHQEVES